MQVILWIVDGIFFVTIIIQLLCDSEFYAETCSWIVCYTHTHIFAHKTHLNGSVKELTKTKIRSRIDVFTIDNDSCVGSQICHTF